MSNIVALCAQEAPEGVGYSYRPDLETEDSRTIVGSTGPLPLGPGASLRINTGKGYLLVVSGVVDVNVGGQVIPIAGGRWMQMGPGDFATEAE